MAGRPNKGKITKKITYAEKNKYNEKPTKSKSNFEFNIGESTEYVGGIHSNYKHMFGVVTKRTEKGHRIDYSILFEDGFEAKCVMQSVLKKKIEVIEEDTIEIIEEDVTE